jgi:hypothetical protein
VTSHCRLGLGTLVSAAQSAPGFGRCRDQGLVRSPGARGKSGIFGCATMATRGDARLPRVPRVQRPPILGVGPLKWLSLLEENVMKRVSNLMFTSVALLMFAMLITVIAQA